jgi:hypothetical protein
MTIIPKNGERGYPQLRITAHGYECGPRWIGWQETDPPDPQEVEACRAFLQLCERTKTGRVGSYWLKHVIEQAVNNYVSNGACLQACRDLGIPAPQIFRSPYGPGGPNGRVAVSLRSIRRIAKGLGL